MRKLLSSTILALTLISCAPATQTPDTPDTPATPTSSEAVKSVADPALWVLKDEDTTVYLFGTVHLLKPELDWQTEKFDLAFIKADAIYQEADTSEEVERALAGLVPSLAFYSDGSTLTETLDAEDEEEVKQALAKFNITLQAADNWKPWFAAMNLSLLQAVKLGYQADKGVEVIITDRANKANKPIRYLETAEWQLRLLAELPEESQIEFLVSAAEDIEENPEMLDDLVDDWLTGDVEGIADLMSDEDAMGDKIVYDAMLTKRNRNWTREIQKLMDAEEGTFLFAVGAAHLAGDDSVINMLRDQGETVTRQ